jgi:hypothetical protein
MKSRTQRASIGGKSIGVFLSQQQQSRGMRFTFENQHDHPPKTKGGSNE